MSESNSSQEQGSALDQVFKAMGYKTDTEKTKEKTAPKLVPNSSTIVKPNVTLIEKDKNDEIKRNLFPQNEEMISPMKESQNLKTEVNVNQTMPQKDLFSQSQSESKIPLSITNPQSNNPFERPLMENNQNCLQNAKTNSKDKNSGNEMQIEKPDNEIPFKSNKDQSQLKTNLGLTENKVCSSFSEIPIFKEAAKSKSKSSLFSVSSFGQNENQNADSNFQKEQPKIEVTKSIVRKELKPKLVISKSLFNLLFDEPLPKKAEIPQRNQKEIPNEISKASQPEPLKIILHPSPKKEIKEAPKVPQVEAPKIISQAPTQKIIQEVPKPVIQPVEEKKIETQPNIPQPPVIPKPELVYTPLRLLNSFTEEAQQTLKEFLCPLCHGVLSSPLFDTQENSYCENCFITYLRYLKTIKDDNKIYSPINGNELKDMPISVTYIEKIILGKDCICKNKDLGCKWIGPLNEYGKHIDKDCPKEKIVCKSKGCTTTLFRDQMKKHEENCDLRIVSCEFCGASMPFRYLKNPHQDTICPKIDINCPQNCGAKIKREELPIHIKDVCFNTVIKCQFADVGCEVTATKKEMENHLSNDCAKHLLLLKNLIQQNKKGTEENIKERNDLELELKPKLINAINDITDVEDRIDLMEKENENEYKMIGRKRKEPQIDESFPSKNQNQNILSMRNEGNFQPMEIEENYEKEELNKKSLSKKPSSKHFPKVTENIQIEQLSQTIVKSQFIEKEKVEEKKEEERPKEESKEEEPPKEELKEEEPPKEVLKEEEPPKEEEKKEEEIPKEKENNILAVQSNQMVSSFIAVPKISQSELKNEEEEDNLSQEGPFKFEDKTQFKIEGNSITLIKPIKNKHSYVFLNKDIPCTGFKLNDHFSWNIQIDSSSPWIGVGLCDKAQVIKNGFVFSYKTKDFNSGSFIICNKGYKFNCNNKRENNVNCFNQMKEGGINVSLKYSPYQKILEFTFKSEKNNNYAVIKSVYPKCGTSLTPCIILLNQNDKVTVSDIKI
ncbi:MAG: hypothetical protein MJ252_07625 [archaeon]|nr:hypothetical protein [archaeon]